MSETIAEHGRLFGLCGYVDGKWEKIVIDDSHRFLLSDGAATAQNQQAIQLALVNLEYGLQLRRGDHTVVKYDGAPENTSIHTLLEVSGNGCLEWLDFGTNHASSYIRVDIDGDYVYLLDPALPGLVVYIYAPLLQYGNEETSLWRLIVFDDVNDYYALCLKRPIWFNTSLLVRYRAGSATAKTSVAAGYHLF